MTDSMNPNNFDIVQQNYINSIQISNVVNVLGLFGCDGSKYRAHE